jgi:LuxR family maltose regulon positive regulatory protein
MDDMLGYNSLMLSPIVSTKLFIPQPRPELIHRPRLFTQLNQGLTRKLTLISAPAGFGKITLVADWAPRSLQSDTRMAWISLDGDNNDLSRFPEVFNFFNQADRWH